MTSSPEITTVLRCRACHGTDLVPYLDLGEQALANAFLPAHRNGGVEFTAPLTVQWCASCGLSQLTHVVSPERLYTDYPYASGVSPGWHKHVEALASEITALRPERQFILDIASNDGTFLEHCQDQGHRVLGIEPAANLARESKVPAIAKFWDQDVAAGVLAFHGPADVVVAQNVFGHVDDARGFLHAVRLVLAPHGVCLIECPHILPLLEQTAFDTIYHEHLSVWSLRALQHVAETAGLAVHHVQVFPHLHGGTVRYYLSPSRKPLSPPGQALLDIETDLWREGLTPYEAFAKRAQANLRTFREALEGVQRAGKRAMGLGASAKGNVLLQASQAPLQAVLDDNPRKQGLVTPGTHLPVLPIRGLERVQVLALLAWNWAEPLQAAALAAGFTGKFLSPVAAPHYL